MSEPLSHHRLLALVEPFARRGHRVDLAASDRIGRRIVFRPVDHPVGPAGRPALHETLELADIDAEGTGGRGGDAACWRLTRTLGLANGQRASLHTDGTDPGALLARIESVDASRQVLAGAGVTIALNHRIEMARAGATGDPILTHGSARVGALLLSLKVPAVTGISAELMLTPATDEAPSALPQDLFGVLGLDWARIERIAAGWTGSVGLRGSGLDRRLDAQAKLQRAAAHLAQTLAEPAHRFHTRHRAARWRVALRRAVPLAACIGLIAAAAAVPRLGLAQDSPLKMLIFNAPPLLLALFFCLREMPRIEIPPLPRVSNAGAWPVVAGADAADASHDERAEHAEHAAPAPRPRPDPSTLPDPAR